MSSTGREDWSSQQKSITPRAVLRRLVLALLLSLGMAGEVMTAAPVTAQQPETVVASLVFAPESAADRVDPPSQTAQCQTQVIPNRALNNGAMRLLMAGRKPDPIESIMTLAMQFQNPTVAAALMNEWSQMLSQFDEHYAELLPTMSPPADTEYSITVQSAEIPEIGEAA